MRKTCAIAPEAGQARRAPESLAGSNRKKLETGLQLPYSVASEARAPLDARPTA